MATNAWYQALGIYGYQHQSFRQSAGVLFVTVAHHGAELRCPHCNGTNIIRRGFIHRTWHAPSVGLHPVVVSAQVPRVECRRCNSTHVVPVPFASPGRSYTHSFERMVVELRRSMTLKDVARLMGVSDWTVRDIEKRWLGRRFKKPKLKHLKRLAIDEISIRKGHVYITLVLDLESGAVVFVGDGKGADALNPFWKRLKASHAEVEAMAMDLSAAYRLAVTTHLPEAAIVFDWFHIVKLLNDKLTALRRDLYRNATNKEQRQVLKGIRWLIIKRSENLNDEKNESERLDEALSLNAPLALAYYLKEELEWMFQERTKTRARRFLEDWIGRARATGLSPLKTFARTLETHAEGDPVVVRPPHLDGSTGRDQQQDQNDETSGLWIPRSGILQTQNSRHPRKQLSTDWIDGLPPAHTIPRRTFYLSDRSRGSPALLKFFTTAFEGTLITDFWSPYDAVVCADKQKCWPHLLRDVAKVDEHVSQERPTGGDSDPVVTSDTGRVWKSFSRCLVSVYRAAKKLHPQRGTLNEDEYDMAAVGLEARLAKFAGESWHHPDANRLSKRLAKYGDELLTFLWYDDVPSDNNAGERAIRPAVMIRKNSYCNHSERGALTQSVLMSVFRTLRLRNHQPLDTILAALSEYSKTGNIPPLLPKNQNQPTD